MLKTILVCADNGLCAAVDTGLSAGCSLFNTHLRHTGFNSLSHTAKLLDFLNMLPCLMSKLICKALNII